MRTLLSELRRQPTDPGMAAPRWASMSRWERRQYRLAESIKIAGRRLRASLMGSRAVGWLARRTGRTVVYATGDSHTRVFELMRRFGGLRRTWWSVRWVPAATCYGLTNLDSETGAAAVIADALAQAPAGGSVVVSLGEVDVGFLCWAMAEHRGIEPEAVLERSLERYEVFLQRHADDLDVILLAASHPTIEDLSRGALLQRRTICVPIGRRRELTTWFNDRLATVADRNGWRVLDTTRRAVDPATGSVRPELHLPGGDHHYRWDLHAEMLGEELLTMQFR